MTATISLVPSLVPSLNGETSVSTSMPTSPRTASPGLEKAVKIEEANGEGGIDVEEIAEELKESGEGDGIVSHISALHFGWTRLGEHYTLFRWISRLGGSEY